jgi:UDP-N-acetylmuramyl pentapeptide synthase
MSLTPVGRKQLRDGVLYRLWPVLSRLARLYRRSLARDTRVIAIVGTFGKSTTTRAACAVLGVPPPKSILANAWSSIALAVLRIERSQRCAVIEVGISAPGEMEQYSHIVRPNVTVVTSVGTEHITEMGSLETTRAEKAWMVRALAETGAAILNGDDANVMWMKGQTRARVITFGFGAGCDVRAEDARLDWPHGMRFRLSAFGQLREARVRLVGRHMIYPALAAIAVSGVEGLPLDESLLRLETLPPTPGRMDPVSLPNGATLLRDDYKSAQETIDRALDVLGEIPARRRMMLLGNVSEPQGPEESVQQALGGRVAAIASHMIIVGDGLQHYGSGARRAGMRSDAVIDGGGTPQQTAEVLARLLQLGDVVLVKGRRNQRLDRVRMIVQGRRVKCDIPFCDIRTIDCEDCPMLETGWDKHRVIM